MNYNSGRPIRPIDQNQVQRADAHLKSVAAILRERLKVRVVPFPAREPENVSEWMHRLRMPTVPRL